MGDMENGSGNGVSANQAEGANLDRLPSSPPSSMQDDVNGVGDVSLPPTMCSGSNDNADEVSVGPGMEVTPVGETGEQVAISQSNLATKSEADIRTGDSSEDAKADTADSTLPSHVDQQENAPQEHLPSHADSNPSTQDTDHSTEQAEADQSAAPPSNTSAQDASSCAHEEKVQKEGTDTPGTTSGHQFDPTGGATAASAMAAASASDSESVYYIKWVLFGSEKVPIVTQNENGPCPLLAIMNVLLLKGKVKLPPMQEMVTSEPLMIYLGECIFDNPPQNLTETTRANYEQNVQDAMGVMYKLQTGLDVNVRFTGVGDFEYTPECIIFDLLEISLYHGWLVDPQDRTTVEAVTNCSYNQLVEKIISNKNSDTEEEVTQALISEQFLVRTASQLTYHGLCELSSVVKEGELCVLFRNNHFSTLYKHQSELFVLVTDQGFLSESRVVWESLSNVEGDGHFVDADFRTYTKPLPPLVSPATDASAVPVGSPEQIDHDYQVALSLLEETDTPPANAWEGFQQEQMACSQADHEFALRLQEEENRRALEEQQEAAASLAARQTQPQGPGQDQGHMHQGPSQEAQRRRGGERVGGERREKEGKDCCIL